MKTAVIDAPNTEVRIEKRHRPSPSRGQVLIRVHACGVCHGDLMLQLGQFPFARYPIVPGHEIAGVIEEVGQDVDKLRPGDRGTFMCPGHSPLWLPGFQQQRITKLTLKSGTAAKVLIGEAQLLLALPR